MTITKCFVVFLGVVAVTQEGVTPLHIAAEIGREAVVSKLLAAGANKNAADHEGFTPLHIAVQNGHQALVRRG